MNSSPHSNELREFLLDRLPPEQADAIEERMFQDAAYFSDLQDAEDELIEEFVTDALDPDETKLFAARVEHSSGLQERVALRRALIRTLQSQPAEAAVSAPALQLQPQRRVWSRILVPGFALAIAILFFVAYTAEHRSGLPSQATGTVAKTASDSAGSRQSAGLQAAAVLFLPAHVARGAAQQPSVLHVGSASLVKLELETPAGDTSTRWNVRLTSGGASVFSADNLPSQQAGVVSYVIAQVPSAQLPPKVYQITLSPQSPAGAVTASWDFRILQ